jgi:hypothetical protein
MGRIGLMGGLGGAINAALCYFRLPISIPMSPTPPTHAIEFLWHVIPAGAAHGALLAVGSVGCARLCWNLRFKMKLVGLLLTTWTVGWLSFIPLRVSVFHESWREAIAWPLASGLAGWFDALRAPITSFGLVAGIYYALLGPGRQLTARARRWHLLMGAISGVLGSLYWWASFNRWPFALLHGAIWGALVGQAVWVAQYGTHGAGRRAQGTA